MALLSDVIKDALGNKHNGIHQPGIIKTGRCDGCNKWNEEEGKKAGRVHRGLHPPGFVTDGTCEACAKIPDPPYPPDAE